MLFATHPKVAEEFAKKTPSIKALPEKKAGGGDWHAQHADKFKANAFKHKK
jgi:hypothetical protein